MRRTRDLRRRLREDEGEGRVPPPYFLYFSFSGGCSRLALDDREGSGLNEGFHTVYKNIPIFFRDRVLSSKVWTIRRSEETKEGKTRVSFLMFNSTNSHQHYPSAQLGGPEGKESGEENRRNANSPHHPSSSPPSLPPPPSPSPLPPSP